MAGSNSAPKRSRVSKTSTVSGHANSNTAEPANGNRKVKRKVTLRFDHLAEAADNKVNVKYASWKCSKQFEIADDVCEGIEESIQHIRGKCLEEGATLGTRMNGLKTCVDIAEVVAYPPPDALGRKIRKNFQSSTEVEDVIIEIVKTFTSPQRQEIWEDMGTKIEETHKNAKGYCMLEGLADVIKLLKGEISNDNAENISDRG